MRNALNNIHQNKEIKTALLWLPDYPTNIARLSYQHTNIFILALQEELNLLFKLHQLLIILIVEVPLAAARHIRERSEGRVVGEPEELMEEGNIVPLRDCLCGARRIAAVCRARPIWPHTDAAGEKERRGCLPPSPSLFCGILPRPIARAEFSSSILPLRAEFSWTPIGCDEACAHQACSP